MTQISRAGAGLQATNFHPQPNKAVDSPSGGLPWRALQLLGFAGRIMVDRRSDSVPVAAKRLDFLCQSNDALMTSPTLSQAATNASIGVCSAAISCSFPLGGPDLRHGRANQQIEVRITASRNESGSGSAVHCRHGSWPQKTGRYRLAAPRSSIGSNAKSALAAIRRWPGPSRGRRGG